MNCACRISNQKCSTRPLFTAWSMATKLFSCSGMVDCVLSDRAHRPTPAGGRGAPMSEWSCTPAPRRLLCSTVQPETSFFRWAKLSVRTRHRLSTYMPARRSFAIAGSSFWTRFTRTPPKLQSSAYQNISVRTLLGRTKRIREVNW